MNDLLEALLGVVAGILSVLVLAISVGGVVSFIKSWRRDGTAHVVLGLSGLLFTGGALCLLISLSVVGFSSAFGAAEVEAVARKVAGWSLLASVLGFLVGLILVGRVPMMTSEDKLPN